MVVSLFLCVDRGAVWTSVGVEMYKIKCCSYPNGETRLVIHPVREARGEDSSLDSSCLDSSEALSFDEKKIDPPLTYALNSTPSDEATRKRVNSHRFTKDAKAKILRAGGALDSHDPNPANTIFFTGTLPGSTEDAIRVFAAVSSEVLHRFQKWIHKKISGENLSFYCWEMQKRGALHLHAAVYCQDASIRKRLIDSFKEFWCGLLIFFGNREGVDLFQRERGGTHRDCWDSVQAYAQECRKSVAAYISKYTGKNAGKGACKYPPKRWSGVSRPLGKLLSGMTEYCSTEVPSYREALSLFRKCKEEIAVPPEACYDYPHKVGLGESRIAYYKEKKDVQECQFLNVSLLLKLKRSPSQFCAYTLREEQSLRLIDLVREAYQVLSESLIHYFHPQMKEHLHIFLESAKKVDGLSLASPSGLLNRNPYQSTLKSLLSAPLRTLFTWAPHSQKELIRLIYLSANLILEGKKAERQLQEVLQIVKRGLTTLPENVDTGTSETPKGESRHEPPHTQMELALL